MYILLILLAVLILFMFQDEHFGCPPSNFGGQMAYETAARQAGLDATKLSYCNGVWYYDGKYTCVTGAGIATDVCDNEQAICAPDLLPHSDVCAPGGTFHSAGNLNCRMQAIAAVVRDGVDASGLCKL